jgi:hypothetical protein
LSVSSSISFLPVADVGNAYKCSNIKASGQNVADVAEKTYNFYNYYFYLFIFISFKIQYYRQHGNKMPIRLSTMRVSDVADSVAVRVRSATFTPR